VGGFTSSAPTGELRLADLVSPPPDPPIVERIRSRLSRDLAWAARAPVEESTWARVRQDAGNVLTVLWRNGELLGARPEQAFYVRCDRTTMTQNDIDNGRLIIEVGVAPVKPAEFVIIRIDQLGRSKRRRRRWCWWRKHAP
jgi:phage tail sheath protein FI